MARFEKVKDKEKERKLLYPLMKYAVDCTKDEFLFDAIYGEDVICPCCCIPAVDHKHIAINHVGKMHYSAHNMSLFYVLDTHNTLFMKRLKYEDLCSSNAIKTSWTNEKSNDVLYNFPFYISAVQMKFIRDVINNKA